MIDEVIDTAVVQASSRIVLYNNVPPGLEADADRDQLFRMLTNLVRNAIQAIEGVQAEDERAPDGAVTFRAWREGTIVTIEVRRYRPRHPRARRATHLFEAFQSAARPGGTGLGLAIAAELMRAHGGDIVLAATGPEGTSFRLTIPDRVTELRTGRRGERRSAAERDASRR